MSLSLVLFPVPLLVKGVLGDIKDEEEFLVSLGGAGWRRGMASLPRGFGAQVQSGVRVECKFRSVLGLRLEMMSMVKESMRL